MDPATRSQGAINVFDAPPALTPQHRESRISCYYIEIDPSCSLYVEESGNPDGIPVVFVHGGPGATFKTTDHQWFDPEKYRIIVYQQRGTSKCIPSVADENSDASIFKDVTIDVLARDMETLKQKLKIEQWLVFGGSWGSTLGLYYAQQFPQSCTGLVLRGIFLSSESELADFFTATKIDERLQSWNRAALEALYEYARSRGHQPTPITMVHIYRQMAVVENDLKAARLFRAFENYIEHPTADGALDRVLKEELATNRDERLAGVWEAQILSTMISQKVDLLDADRMAKIEGIPVQIVQGTNDTVCPPPVANTVVIRLREAGCNVNYSLIEGGEHSPYSTPEMTGALVRATDRFAKTKSFDEPHSAY